MHYACIYDKPAALFGESNINLLKQLSLGIKQHFEVDICGE